LLDWFEVDLYCRSCLIFFTFFFLANRLTRQHIATHRNILKHTATHCNTLQHIAKHCDTLCNTQQHTATHCNTLQHTATHCNTNRHHLRDGCSTWSLRDRRIISSQYCPSSLASLSTCNVLQCVAVCCSVLQCVAVCWRVSEHFEPLPTVARFSVYLQCVVVCCRVLQCVAVCRSVLQCVAVYYNELQSVAVCYSASKHLEPVTPKLTRLSVLQQHTATHCNSLANKESQGNIAQSHLLLCLAVR